MHCRGGWKIAVSKFNYLWLWIGNNSLYGSMGLKRISDSKLKAKRNVQTGSMPFSSTSISQWVNSYWCQHQKRRSFGSMIRLQRRNSSSRQVRLIYCCSNATMLEARSYGLIHKVNGVSFWRKSESNFLFRPHWHVSTLWWWTWWSLSGGCNQRRCLCESMVRYFSCTWELLL